MCGVGPQVGHAIDIHHDEVVSNFVSSRAHLTPLVKWFGLVSLGLLHDRVEQNSLGFSEQLRLVLLQSKDIAITKAIDVIVANTFLMGKRVSS